MQTVNLSNSVSVAAVPSELKPGAVALIVRKGIFVTDVIAEAKDCEELAWALLQAVQAARLRAPV